MKVKRYLAADMAQACDQIRRELGPDAVIISSRKRKSGGVLRFSSRELLEVVAGIPGDEAAPPEVAKAEPAQSETRSSVIAKAKAALLAAAAQSTHLSTADGAATLEISAAAHQAAAQAALAEAIRPAAEAAPESASPAAGEETAAAPREEAAPAVAIAKGPPAISVARPALTAEQFEARVAELRGQIADLRRTVLTVLPRSGAPDAALPEAAGAVIRQLRLAGVSEALLITTIDGVRDLLDSHAGAEAVHTALREALLSHMAAHSTPTFERGKSSVVFLLGPAGSGKTTSAIKLALRLSRAEGHPVVLANADWQRPGAGLQLAAYGEALGLPTAAVYEPSDLKALVAAHPNTITVVDLPGRPPRNTAALTTYKGLINAVRRHQVYLTLSATEKLADLERAATAYRGLPINGLILTKVDETERLGEALSFLATVATPLLFVANGPDVLTDLAAAGPAALLDLALQSALEAAHAEYAAS